MVHVFFSIAVVNLIPIVLSLGLKPRERYEVTAAVAAGDIRKVDAFIDHAPWRLNAPVIRQCDSLVSMAAFAGQPRLAEHLRKRGARVDMTTAVRLGWDDEVRRIAKADPGAVTRRGPDGFPIDKALTSRQPS